MDIRRNIIISLILHITLFTLSFPLNFREKACLLPERHLIVSVVEETATTKSVTSSPLSPQLETVSDGIYQKGITSPEFALSNNTGFFANAQNDRKRGNDIRQRNDKGESAFANIKVGTTISVNQQVGISEEMNMLNANTNENEISPSIPPLVKGGEGGLIGQNTSFQNATKSRSEDEILKSPKKEASKRDTDLYAFIRSSIERTKTYPLIARKRGIEGTVLVSFRIDGRGLPQDITIIKSSGHQILDEEIPKMLRKASPFPRLREEIVIPITFKLTESTLER